MLFVHEIFSPLPAKPKGTISLPSVCPSVLLSVRPSFCHSAVSFPDSAVDEDIQLKFYIWLHLNDLQTKFEFRYVWPTFDWIIALGVHILVFRTFVCPGWSEVLEIFYMAFSWIVVDQIRVSVHLTLFDWIMALFKLRHLVFWLITEKYLVYSHQLWFFDAF